MQWLIDIVYALVMTRMAGLIVMWSGTLDDIPDGWQLCDGTNGTPDLRGRFIRSASVLLPPHDQGGSEQHRHLFNDGPHTHDFTTNGHLHTLEGPNAHAIGYSAPSIIDTVQDSGTTDETTVVGLTNLVDNQPPYYSLAYIMKI